MGVQAISPTGVLLPVGGVWLLDVEVRDVDCDLTATAPTAVVTPPAGGTVTPAWSEVSTGRYRAAYTVATAGRYVAVVTVADVGVATFAAWVTGPTTAAGMPIAADVVTYLGGEEASSWAEEDVQGALDAEMAAQRSVCRVRAVYPDDMREALLRRVARNLAMRKLPLAVLQGDAETGSSGVLPGRDPEVRRLEAPHRRMTVG